MATRQEIIVGYTLALWSHRITDNIWCACHVMQEVHPYTGAPLLKDTAIGLQTPFSLLDINKEVDLVFLANEATTDHINNYILNGDSKLIDEGLKYHKLTIIPIQSDLTLCDNTKNDIITDKTVALTKESLASIGETNLPDKFAIDDFIHPTALVYPLSTRYYRCIEL